MVTYRKILSRADLDIPKPVPVGLYIDKDTRAVLREMQRKSRVGGTSWSLAQVVEVLLAWAYNRIPNNPHRLYTTPKSAPGTRLFLDWRRENA